MALLELKNISISFGGPLILDQASMKLEKREKVALIGRNGEGKSSLLKIVTEEIDPDGGEKFIQKYLKIGYLPQELPIYKKEATILEVLLNEFPKETKILKKYYSLLGNQTNEKLIKELAELEQQILEKGYFDFERKISEMLSKFNLDSGLIFDNLSTGQKRKVLLAKSLISDPDILVLDEPTNHLDIETIAWLEDFLDNLRITLFFVTHDRSFLKRLATRIIELDRGQLKSYSGNYENYLEIKEHELEVEKVHNEKFDKKLKAEEIWLRKGIKARRTRNEGRVRSLKKLREERRNRRELSASASFKIQDSLSRSKKIILAEKISFNYPNNTREIVKDFSLYLENGDKIGLIGSNGSGKTTLLKLLIGKLSPSSGKIWQKDDLKISYYDQNKADLDEEKSIKENLSQTSDTIFFNDRPLHIVSYLENFLFPSSRIDTPVKALSGGEKNRLMLAKLFATAADLFILDEPTNDLDIESLDLLESLLVEFKGTILFISHDRSFINNVATMVLAYEGSGVFKEYVGGYDDWLFTKKKNQALVTAEKNAKVKKNNSPQKKAKLSFKEKKELEALPSKIEELEEEKEDLIAEMGSETVFENGGIRLKEINQRLAEIDQILEELYERWEYLESFN